MSNDDQLYRPKEWENASQSLGSSHNKPAAGTVIVQFDQSLGSKYQSASGALSNFRFSPADGFEMTALKKELDAAKAQAATSLQQIAALQQQLTQNPTADQVAALQTQVKELTTSIEQTQTQLSQAQARTNDLTAPVVIPAREALKVSLVPTSTLDRLQEYHADETWGFSLAGLFGGGVLSVVITWFTSEQMAITKSAILLVVLLLLLTGASIYWISRVRRRAATVQAQMLQLATTQESSSAASSSVSSTPPSI